MEITTVRNWRAWVRSIRAGESKYAYLEKGQNIRSVRCAANVINTDYRADGRDIFVHIQFLWQERKVIAIATTASEIPKYNSPNDWKSKNKEDHTGDDKTTGD